MLSRRREGRAVFAGDPPLIRKNGGTRQPSAIRPEVLRLVLEDALYDPNDQNDHYQGTNQSVSQHGCLLTKQRFNVRALKFRFQLHCRLFLQPYLFISAHQRLIEL
jgi:hypothetical protein